MDIFARFPDMKPIRSAPGLFTMNGIGTSVVGRRDVDPETGTYVKTHCVCLLFVPVLALGAYRVADADQGWYFVGKVPLSKFAKSWNLLVLLAVLSGAGLIWWNVHTGSPEYAARQRLARADKMAVGGKPAEAAKEYRELLTGPAAAEARAGLGRLLDAPSADLAEALDLFKVAVDLNRQGRLTVPDLYDRVRRHAEAHAARDPTGALALLDLVQSLAPTPDEPLAVQRQLLERLVAADPKALGPVSRLARLYEAKGETERCEKLLLPLAADLGASDGAAVLGRLYAGKGQFDQAIALLRPYVDARLPTLRAAENRATAAEKAVEQRVISQLQAGSAPGFDFTAYDRGTKDQQRGMVIEYLQRVLRDDPAVRDAGELMAQSSAVVPAAFDLGLAHVQRGQAAADPAARKRDLEEAEQTFLSIRAFVGESDTYKVSLGQVYYWLGRAADGKKLFDEVRAGGKPEAALQVCEKLREVGAVTDARAVAEDVHATATDPAVKRAAALVRSMTSKDLDDKIVWLERCDADNPETKSALAWSRGNRAVRDGQPDQAAVHFRTALDAYRNLPENESTLNNAALVHFDLAALTGDPAEFARGVEKIDRAVALRPTDSILLHNAAGVVSSGALAELAAAAIDLAKLQRRGGWDLLPFLYADTAGRDAVAAKLKAHPGVVKARGYYEKLLVLAPRRDDGYQGLSAIYSWGRDEPALKALAARVEAADLDLEAELKEARETLAGRLPDARLDELKKGIARTRETLDRVTGGKGVTYAVAVSGYVTAAVAGQVFGVPADVDELVKLAEDALAAADCDGARDTVTTARLYRAHVRLAESSTEYAALAKKTERSLGFSLLSYAAAAGGPLAKTVAADPDVKDLVERFRKRAATDPAGCGMVEWAVLAASDPTAAEAVAAAYRRSGHKRHQRAIDLKLYPLSGGSALWAYFDRRMTGDAAGAKTCLKEAAARGLPMPGE